MQLCAASVAVRSVTSFDVSMVLPSGSRPGGTIAENITPLVREAIPCRSSFRPQESIVFSGTVESLEECNCDEKRYRHKTADVYRCRSAVSKHTDMEKADDVCRPSSGEVQDAGALCQW